MYAHVWYIAPAWKAGENDFASFPPYWKLHALIWDYSFVRYCSVAIDNLFGNLRWTIADPKCHVLLCRCKCLMKVLLGSVFTSQRSTQIETRRALRLPKLSGICKVLLASGKQSDSCSLVYYGFILKNQSVRVSAWRWSVQQWRTEVPLLFVCALSSKMQLQIWTFEDHRSSSNSAFKGGYLL